MRKISSWFTMAMVAATLALAQNASAVSATGGTVTDVDGYRIHTFTGDGTFTVTAGEVEVLVVAGGGGGGAAIAGGGGAGGLIYSNSFPVSGSIAVTVGPGGAGGTLGSYVGFAGSRGTNSQFGALIALGGGGGGGWENSQTPTTGGSGGGGSAGASGAASEDSQQGYSGGTGGGYGINYPGGGGGGAGSVGSNATDTVAGDGGIGRSFPQFAGVAGDTNYPGEGWFAGGGGGATYNGGTEGKGGKGGGGNGGLAGADSIGLPGQPGTGGGGGGASMNNNWPGVPGVAGGSGIVIVRYRLADTPIIQNLAATNVTTTSAWLNGFISSTGGAPVTAVTVYWGPADGGGTAGGLWAHTNSVTGGPWIKNAVATFQASSLTENTFYYYRFAATNSFGSESALSSERFLAGNVTVTSPDSMAAWDAVTPETGTLTIQRDPSATGDSLTVNYAWGGTAILNADFTPSPAGTSVTLPAGVDSTNFTITPLWGPNATLGSTVWLSLLPGEYAIGSPASNEVTIAVAVAVPGANATTKAGVWSDNTIWSLGRQPIQGDDVTVGHSVLLTNATVDLNSCTISGAALTFTNWMSALRATTITVEASGVLTHLPCNTNAAIENTNRVYIVCTNLTVLGMIDVNSKGFLGGADAGLFGQGPGAARDEGGASYGGLGGGISGHFGPTYGSLSAPSDPGSGGGGRAPSEQGDAGGGAVWIEASGSVLLNGTISADGEEPGYRGNRGGGSGGSIYIACNTFVSTNGILRAEGSDVGDGAGQTGIGGGGGRIAVVFNTTAQHTLNLTDRPLLTVYANGGYGYNGTRSGEPGTLFMSDASFFPATNNVLHGGLLLIDGFTTWAPDSLTIDSGRAGFPAGFTLTVTNDLLITGTGGGLQTTNAVVNVGRDLLSDAVTPSMLYGGPRSTLAVGRDLIVQAGSFNWYGASTNTSLLGVARYCMVTNSGLLHLHAGETNGIAPAYGARVTVGHMIMAANSWILPYSHPINGGSVTIEAGNITAQADGGIDADAKGYGSQGPWDGNLKWGYGPGAGYAGGGAGYGGVGGTPKYDGTAGGTYGSSDAPADPGSGGGVYGGYAGGMGGGLVWLNVKKTLTVDGDIRARGNISPWVPYAVDIGGGGSGGGIYIRCKRLAGGATGRILADGGVSHYEQDWSGAGGGGGRIAVWREIDTYAGSSSVAAGLAYDEARTGAPGTIVWGQSRNPGTIIVIK